MDQEKSIVEKTQEAENLTWEERKTKSIKCYICGGWYKYYHKVKHELTNKHRRAEGYLIPETRGRKSIKHHKENAFGNVIFTDSETDFSSVESDNETDSQHESFEKKAKIFNSILSIKKQIQELETVYEDL
jgi:hypothetical protein